ncbi:protein Skeletor, isoforms B/C isoform X1 [Bombyx mandarina]|uniref:Protein Skeletor, isoforms B/C isoform X1 n=1 Tax=Bombyx mandarina TaxID=7092 RepID=A0A6J2JF70_BOMMA|nr:protein Skeletor, isoforms B/C isoform X1 [Bombyx mandarina]
MGSRSIALLLALGIAGGFAQARYYGKDLGPLSQLHHGVRGRVYAVDSKTLFIQDFHYDGEGPAAYFYVGKSKSPDAAGATRLRDERGGAGALRRYRGEPVTISLSDGLTLKDIRWFSVWCDEYAVNFGDVSIPRDLDYPKPAKVGALRGIHGVSSDQIIVVDAQTLLITNFSYDGEAPDAKFWVGRGDQPSPQGIRIPDENGKEDPLRKYDKKTIVLTLPGDLTVFDIGHFGVWCEAFTVDFGHITLPRAQVSNVPPSLKMLGVSPQSRNKALAAAERPTPKPTRKPLARLDATTYRPHLRLGTGLLQALTDQPEDHTSLHRRADDYTPPKQQLVDEPTKPSEQVLQGDTFIHQITPVYIQDFEHLSPDQQVSRQDEQQQDYTQQHQLAPQNYFQQPTYDYYRRQLIEQQDAYLRQQRYQQIPQYYQVTPAQYRVQNEPFQYSLLPRQAGGARPRGGSDDLDPRASGLQ